MGTVEFEWEDIVVGQSPNSKTKRLNTVWLVAKNAKKDDDRLNIIRMSSDIIEKAGWYQGIRVNLARQGNSLFRFN